MENLPKEKSILGLINDNAGVITLIITFLASVSVFILGLISQRYEMGYSAFFGLETNMKIEYDFVRIFFIFIIVILFFASAFLAMYPDFKKKEGIGVDKIRMFCMQMLITLLIVSIFYLFVLTQIALSDEDIVRYIYLPAIPLVIMLFIIMYTETKKSKNIASKYILIATVCLTLITILLVNWAIFDIIDWKEPIIFTIKITMVSCYFTGVGWLIDKIMKILHKGTKSDPPKKESTNLTPFYVMLTVMVCFIIPIAFLLIQITSFGWSSAERTSEIYTTIYDEKAYILFEQDDDYYIALPIENISEDPIENKVTMKSIEDEYRYLNKENIAVKLIKLDKIQRSENEDSIRIEFSKNMMTDKINDTSSK